MTTHRAAWLFPVDAPPLQNGVLSISQGRIAAIEPFQGQRIDQDHGDAALLPGLVNTHVHLDLGGLRGKLPPPATFTDWLQAVVAYRRTSTLEEWDAAISAGIRESLRHGTTLVGDISVAGRSAALLRTSPLKGVVFYELLSLSRTRAEQVWQAAMEWLAHEPTSETVRPGFSPHAPYTVHAWLLEKAVTYAAPAGMPVAMHLAETQAEAELLEQHQGLFRAFLEKLGVWEPSGLAANIQEVAQTLGNHSLSLIAHGNYLSPKELAYIRSSVVYCPRTHAYFGHAPHPFRDMLHAGINVALGTDSLASNPDLNLWEEMRFLARHHPDLPGAVLLRMGTLNGAAALGFAATTGSLTPGKMADFVVLELPTKTGADIHRLLWEDAAQVRAVYAAGQRVWPRDSLLRAPGPLG